MRYIKSRKSRSAQAEEKPIPLDEQTSNQALDELSEATVSDTVIHTKTEHDTDTDSTTISTDTAQEDNASVSPGVGATADDTVRLDKPARTPVVGAVDDQATAATLKLDTPMSASAAEKTDRLLKLDEPTPTSAVDATSVEADEKTVKLDKAADNPEKKSIAVPQPTQVGRRRRGSILSAATKILAILLVSLLIIGGFAFIAYSTTVSYRKAIVYNTTVVVQQTRSSARTAQTQAQATSQALGTAQAHVAITATTQADTAAQATAAVDNATATASAQGDNYTNATNGTPVLDDPLSDNTGTGSWDTGSPSTNTGCTFTDSVYHASEAKQGYLQPCIAQNSRFSSFAYQVHMTINKGNPGQGGLLFRIDASNQSYYFFRIGTDGTYALDLYQGTNQKTLTSGNSTAITTGLGQSNQLAVIANSDTLSLFANGQALASVTDGSLSAGKIGLGVENKGTPLDASFNDAQVWQLQATATPTPDTSLTPTGTDQAGLTPTGTDQSGLTPTGTMDPSQSSPTVVPAQ